MHTQPHNDVFGNQKNQVPQRRPKEAKKLHTMGKPRWQDRASGYCRSSTPSWRRLAIKMSTACRLPTGSHGSLFRVFSQPAFFLFIALSWDFFAVFLGDE
uniref:Uncharacterized protein n=1 Tax=Opuntia streptacantha TaxID=393608 RepID=A0A7C8ZLD9_OPUST